MHDALRIDDPVQLRAPVMVIGLSGWGNAGDVATFATRYLAEQRDARRLGEIRVEGFHDYFLHRPVVAIEGASSARTNPHGTSCSTRGSPTW